MWYFETKIAIAITITKKSVIDCNQLRLPHAWCILIIHIYIFKGLFEARIDFNDIIIFNYLVVGKNLYQKT